MKLKILSLIKRITVGAAIRSFVERKRILSKVYKRILLHSFCESNMKVTRKQCVLAEKGRKKRGSSIMNKLYAVSFLSGMTGGELYGYH